MCSCKATERLAARALRQRSSDRSWQPLAGCSLGAAKVGAAARELQQGTTFTGGRIGLAAQARAVPGRASPAAQRHGCKSAREQLARRIVAHSRTFAWIHAGKISPTAGASADAFRSKPARLASGARVA